MWTISKYTADIVLLEIKTCVNLEDIRPVHYDAMTCKYFPPFWPLVREIHRLPVGTLTKVRYCWALVIYLLLVWTSDWVKQSYCRWFEMLWCYCDVSVMHFEIKSISFKVCAQICFVLLCFVLVIITFSWIRLSHLPQVWYSGTGAIIWLLLSRAAGPMRSHGDPLTVSFPFSFSFFILIL